MNETKFNTSIKGKILIAFFISAAALYGAYWVNRLAFKDMQAAISDLSFPHKKLQTVNLLFSEITVFDRLFKNMAAGNDEKSLDVFITHSQTIQIYLDSLQRLCADNDRQYSLADSVKNMMIERQELLLSYTKYRLSLKNNKHFSKQVNMLDSLLSLSRQKTDSLVFTSEHTKTVTTVEPTDIPEKKKKGFWANLFKRSSKEESGDKSQKIIEQESNVKVDTLVLAQQDTGYIAAKKLINAMAKEQIIRRQIFFNKDLELAEFETVFNSKVTEILTEVEKEVIFQIDITNNRVQQVINGSQNRVNVIIVIFFLFSAAIIFFIITDVTKSNLYRKQVEQAKEEAEHHSLARQRFLSNMSHEIRTPLQSIIGYAEQIKQQEQPDKQDVEAVYRSAEHLLQVVNEILDYSRITSGKFVFDKAVFDMQQVIEEVVAIMKPQAEKKGLSLVLKYNQVIQNNVSGDVFRLKQILLNLLGNSVKFTLKGEITLIINSEILNDKARYHFSVEDTGIGIPKEQQARVFDYFEQGSHALNQFHVGTGLGLSIVKALVEQQGGSITLESEQGRGSCFSFSIIYDVADTKEHQAHRSEIAVVSNFTGHVWLVDDDALILKLCSDILKKHAISHTCFNSPDALLVATADKQKQQPVLFLVDIRMAGMNGLILFDKLKEKGYTTQRFVALTAQALPEEQEIILKHGFDAILLKPFKEKDFINTVVNKNVVAQHIHNLQLDEEIKQQYIKETTEDVAALNKAIELKNIEKITFFLHRLSGRTAQIGYKELGATLRKLELDFGRTYVEPHGHPESVEGYVALCTAINDINALLDNMRV